MGGNVFVPVRLVTVALAVVFGVAFFFFLQVSAQGQPEGAGQERSIEKEGDEAYAAARLVVTYEDGASEAAEDGAVEEVEGEVKKEISPLDAEVVVLPEVADERPGEARKDALEQARQKLENEPGVEEVNYDYLRKPNYTPNDADFPEQYGLKKPRFPQAWGPDKGNDGNGVKIAVVDTGIDARHPDLRGKISAQADFVNDDRIAEDDSVGHGTHVAGIAAAATNNRTGIAGGCPDCKLLVAKALTDEGGFDSDIAEGIVWSADNGAKAINLSFGGPEPARILKEAVNYAHKKGAVLVAAAGNSGEGGREYPAAYPRVIAVAATDARDRRASFSSTGRYVDVAAPGVEILSTAPGGNYTSYSGTSFSSPHVAALAGLLAGEGQSKKQIRRSILSTTQDLGPKGRDPEYGAGRIDASRALGR